MKTRAPCGRTSPFSSSSKVFACSFLFLSAKGDAAVLKEAKDLGADGYLTKPVVREDLLGAVNERLEKGRRSGSEPVRNENPNSPSDEVSGGLRESLAVLLSGTGILRHHSGSLTEEERLAQRAAMLEAGNRLSAAMKKSPESDV